MKKTSLKILSLITLVIVTDQTSPAQWVQTNGPSAGSYNYNTFCLAISDSNLVAGTGDGVFISTDNGTSWTATGLKAVQIYALLPFDTNLFAGTDRGVFVSTDNGTTWSSTDSGWTNAVSSLAISSKNIFAGTWNSDVFVSTDNGKSWDSTGLTNTGVWSLFLSGTNLFAGPAGLEAFLSIDNGKTWNPVNSGLPTHTTVEAFAICNTNLFAGTYGGSGVFRSTNNGTNWSPVNSGLPNASVTALAVSDTNLFAGTDSGVFLSTNNGTGWRAVNSGLTIPYVNALTVYGSNLFAGTGDGVWKRSLSEITNVNQSKGEAPKAFSLFQNYPNPFNPTTTISFSIASKSFVSLKVFDIVGRAVATIVSAEMSAGDHSLQWNAANEPSGLYFYRLQVGSFSETKKLTLIK